VAGTTVLEKDEIVLQIEIPRPDPETRSAFIKFALRKSIDFPIVNCAAAVTRKDQKINQARICLNAVYVKPYRTVLAEKVLEGKVLDEKMAEEAGEAAVAGATPLTHNGYLVPIARALTQRAVLACQ
jgi:xanthine dehydrogenase YagS FAD-binding subunit